MLEIISICPGKLKGNLVNYLQSYISFLQQQLEPTISNKFSV